MRCPAADVDVPSLFLPTVGHLGFSAGALSFIQHRLGPECG
jgi:hypothetical protein